MSAPMMDGTCAVTGESIAVQSRANMTTLTTRSPAEQSPIPQASRADRRSQRAVIKGTISVSSSAVDGAAAPRERVAALLSSRVTAFRLSSVASIRGVQAALQRKSACLTSWARCRLPRD